MDMVHRVAQLLLDWLVRVIAAELIIFVDRARDDADVQALGLARLAIGEEGQAFLIAVGQPILEAEAIALRLGNLLALLVEEHLVVETLGRSAAEHARNRARLD